MRINKFVARATGMGRRKVDSLVEGGQILVNGSPARVGQSIEEGDVVTLAGKTLKIPKYTYLMFNKPTGCVSSRQSQRGIKTVYDLLPSNFRSLKLVGRLDKESSGLILLTDDGDFAHKMLHPSHGKTKIYEVELDKELPADDAHEIEMGVALDDGLSTLKILERTANKQKVQLSEGRNRQIRRTYAALGYEVVHLHRTEFGPYKLNGLKPGEHKLVAINE